jgi:hypothetical protein
MTRQPSDGKVAGMRLPPRWRKAVLTVHVITAVGWLGGTGRRAAEPGPDQSRGGADGVDEPAGVRDRAVHVQAVGAGEDAHRELTESAKMVIKSPSAANSGSTFASDCRTIPS